LWVLLASLSPMDGPDESEQQRLAAIGAVAEARGVYDRAANALKAADEGRKRAIYVAAKAGLSLVEISVYAGLSKQRISQIVEENRGSEG
jgi:hypothetical protein